MGSITALGIVLLLLMIVVGGKQGITSFLSMVVNFGILFFSIVLIAFHMPPIIVTVVASVILLSITIFWSSASDNASTTAFQAACIILILLVAIIIPLEYWAQVGGFGLEDSEELEGLSIYVGIDFTKIAIATAILSSLGAIAEAAIAIASGLDEIITQHDKIRSEALFADGVFIGKQIIGTAVNTLFFGFFGSSMALFIWFYGLNYSFGEILNDKVFAAELIAIIISLIGVVLTIPITTWMMSLRLKKLQTKKESK
ncbi:YibE/F family protein [Lentilactobacillus kisonensis]|uniref:YibE F-like protein n=2 Tax=Lentilactobacillus kisonensis TaxID=481722 RepID=A0A0R1NJE0_9LACO|nr:YibE/F family protein [Lentilactobacillus kisonensis]KRL20544.1 YibE F-like protein [Lentilactobacillus kisonensis DSM 19906 = JCM 15041]